MRRKEHNIEVARLRRAERLLRAGGDNFQWVGFGRLQFNFMGRGGAKRALEPVRKYA